MAISTIRSHAIRFRMRVRPPIKWNALRTAHRKALAAILAELKRSLGNGRRGSSHRFHGAVKRIAGKLTGNRALETLGRVENNIGKAQLKVGKATKSMRDMVGKTGKAPSLT